MASQNPPRQPTEPIFLPSTIATSSSNLRQTPFTAPLSVSLLIDQCLGLAQPGQIISQPMRLPLTLSPEQIEQHVDLVVDQITEQLRVFDDGFHMFNDFVSSRDWSESETKTNWAVFIGEILATQSALRTRCLMQLYRRQLSTDVSDEVREERLTFIARLGMPLLMSVPGVHIRNLGKTFATGTIRQNVFDRPGLERYLERNKLQPQGWVRAEEPETVATASVHSSEVSRIKIDISDEEGLQEAEARANDEQCADGRDHYEPDAIWVYQPKPSHTLKRPVIALVVEAKPTNDYVRPLDLVSLSNFRC